jgi:ATP-dependent DNA ligase
VKKLSVEIPASYVAFDLLALGSESLLDEPFKDRRAGLERLLKKAKPPIYVTPATLSRDEAIRWFDAFEGAGFDGVVAKPLGGTYQPGARAMLKVKHERTCDCVVAGYRMHKDGEGLGSLLLGLYDDDGTLHHVGVASAMAAPRRKELLEDVQPYRKNALKDHPWADWANAMHEAAESGQRMPGGPSRWNASKDLSWEPLRIERVAEVEYEGLLSGRFRHNARFRRWRDDRDPDSCTYSQLESVAPAELLEMFGA